MTTTTERTTPVARVIDDLASFETPAMRWLRGAGPIAKAANDASRFDHLLDTHQEGPAA